MSNLKKKFSWKGLSTGARNSQYAKIIKNTSFPGFNFLDSYYDEFKFKKIRHSYVDDALGKLGVTFFAFEYVDFCSEPSQVEILKDIYSGNRYLDPNKKSAFFQHSVASRLKKLLRFKDYSIQEQSFFEDSDYHQQVPTLTEFAYFVLDTNRPPADSIDSFHRKNWEYKVTNFNDRYGPLTFGEKWGGGFSTFDGGIKKIDTVCEEFRDFFNSSPLSSSGEFFLVKGLLAVRNLVGYNECDPLIREIEDNLFSFTLKKNFKHDSNYKILSSTAQALLSSVEVKNYWDELVRPASLIDGNMTGMLETSSYHGFCAFRLQKNEEAEPFYNYWYSDCFWGLNTSYVSDREGLTWWDGFFFAESACNRLSWPPNKCNYKPSDSLNVIGVPVKCSYSTSAVLYNLFEIFCQVHRISYIDGIYYQEVSGSFFKFLGNAFWFKDNYFEIVDYLITRFGSFVMGIDYYKLFSAQIENVLNLMKTKPLTTDSFRIKSKIVSNKNTRFERIDYPKLRSYVSN